MYPDKWIGIEAFSTEHHVLKDVEKTFLELSQKQKSEKIREFNIASIDVNDFSKDEFAEHQTTLEKSRKAIQLLSLELRRIREFQPTMQSDQDAYNRRKAIEAQLCNAIRKRDLDIVTILGNSLNGRDWQKNEPIDISFAYSIVYFPPEYGSRKRNPAYIDKHAFENWIVNQSGASIAALAGTERERQAVWAREYIRKNEMPVKRDTFIHDIQTEFMELSERGAKVIWKETAPETWKKPGQKVIKSVQ